jgi:hypothetical protein
VAIPTQVDRDLAEIDSAASTVLLRLRTYHHAGPNRTPATIREALQVYVDKVTDFVNDHQR